MSPCVMVTAYRASSCWISTRSSVDKDLPALHNEPHVLRDGDVLQRVAGNGDDVGEQSLGQPRLVHDGAQLLVGVVLRPGAPVVRHYPARRAYLDQLRAVLDLVPDRL